MGEAAPGSVGFMGLFPRKYTKHSSFSLEAKAMTLAGPTLEKMAAVWSRRIQKGIGKTGYIKIHHN